MTCPREGAEIVERTAGPSNPLAPGSAPELPLILGALGERGPRDPGGASRPKQRGRDGMKKQLRVIAALTAAGLCLGLGRYSLADKEDKPASDREFALEAARGGMMEVKLGKLATERAASDGVKKFGERMVKDHSKANKELMDILAKKGI